MQYLLFAIIWLISLIRFPFMLLKHKLNVTKAWKESGNWLNIQ